MSYNLYQRTKDGIKSLAMGANYRETELYRAHIGAELEVFDVGSDPYEESRAKKRERNMEAEQEARRIADRHFTLATCDHFGSF